MPDKRDVSEPALLTAAHDTSAFDCGVPALNTWLKTKALKNQRLMGQTYVACRGDQVVGFYTLAPGSIEHKGTPGKFRRNAPDPIPIIKLCRLAVDASEQGTGLGVDLLAHMIRAAKAAQAIQGGRAVVVDAKDDQARAFYEKHGFVQSVLNDKVLFFDLK